MVSSPLTIFALGGLSFFVVLEDFGVTARKKVETVGKGRRPLKSEEERGTRTCNVLEICSDLKGTRSATESKGKRKTKVTRKLTFFHNDILHH